MTSSDRIRFRTITRTRLLSLEPQAQRDTLLSIYRSNATKLNEALTFCLEEDIKLYRVPSTLFPFADHAIGSPVFATLRRVLRRIGVRATACAIRLVSHPDQYVVLNSELPSVVANSRMILDTKPESAITSGSRAARGMRSPCMAVKVDAASSWWMPSRRCRPRCAAV